MSETTPEEQPSEQSDIESATSGHEHSHHTKSSQSMKPATAAKKLGIYLPAAPESFQDSTITRSELEAWSTEPPQWLSDLRANGPHPKQVVAGKLGVSVSGLARSGITDALTTDQIAALLKEMPEWLAHERSVQAGVRNEQKRLKNAAKRSAR